MIAVYLGGVGIQVQFTGDGARKDMQILSGGQKSLVADTNICYSSLRLGSVLPV
jgi:hypothetical protein